MRDRSQKGLPAVATNPANGKADIGPSDACMGRLQELKRRKGRLRASLLALPAKCTKDTEVPAARNKAKQERSLRMDLITLNKASAKVALDLYLSRT